MRAISQKKSLVLVLTLGLILGWTLAAGAQLIPKSKEDLEQQKERQANLLQKPKPASKPDPTSTERTGGVIRFKGAKTIKVEVKKPRVQLFFRRRDPVIGKGGLERTFRETLRGASAWERGHVPKIAMRKAKGEKIQTETEHAQEVKAEETQEKK